MRTATYGEDHLRRTKGSSHLLLLPDPSITPVALSAPGPIRREPSHLSCASNSKCAGVNNGPEAFVFHINVINRKGCQMSTVTGPLGSEPQVASIWFYRPRETHQAVVSINLHLCHVRKHKPPDDKKMCSSFVAWSLMTRRGGGTRRHQTVN